MKKVLRFLLWTGMGTAAFCTLFAVGYFGYLFVFDNQPKDPQATAITMPSDTTALASLDTVGEHACITFRHFYTECSHINEEVIQAPNQYGGKTLDELLSVYPGSVMESKTDEEIVIKVYENQKCAKHYLAKWENDTITIVYQNDLKKEKDTIYKPASTLSYDDMVLLTQGVFLESDSELTAFLEDYGS